MRNLQGIAFIWTQNRDFQICISVPLSPAERLVVFEPGTFRFWFQSLNPLSHTKSTGPFLSPKFQQYAQNSQWVQNSIFPNGKHIFPNSSVNSYDLGKFNIFFIVLTFKRQSHKLFKDTQTIHRRIIRVCLTILWNWPLKG